MERLITIVAGTAVFSGVLVLLGWFSLPIRVLLLIGTFGLVLCARPWRSIRVRSLLHALPVLALAAGAIAILAAADITTSIRSPWPQVPAAFFVLYALLAATTVLLVWQRPRVSAIGVALALCVASLVAILVYPIGFGFDHFLHVAAERIIVEYGALTPPPYTYSAHYGFVGLLTTLGIPIALADRILVPLVGVLLIVPLAHRTLPRGGTLALLIAPFLPLAVSTPQALSYCFALATMLVIARSPRRSNPGHSQIATTSSTSALTMTLCCAAAIFANPLTGIPTLGAVTSALLIRRGWRVLGAFAALGGIVALPIALGIAGRIIPSFVLTIGFSLAPLHALGTSVREALALHTQDLSTADALAVARIALPILWIVLALVGARITRRTALLIPPLIALGAAAAVLLTTTIPTQLAEEQTDFPLRLLALAALFAIPLVGNTLNTILARLHTRTHRAAGAVILAALATLTLLLAYPRDDAQTRSGLWSVSNDDIAAVHAIAADAGDAPYVVLANQMLGAAAIREFGFRPSYSTANGEILAFPLPAGGPVAREFWEYVDHDIVARAPIDTALALVNATRAYVVLHDYWTNYTTLTATTAVIADAEIGTLEHVRIFRFDAE